MLFDGFRKSTAKKNVQRKGKNLMIEKGTSGFLYKKDRKRGGREKRAGNWGTF